MIIDIVRIVIRIVKIDTRHDEMGKKTFLSILLSKHYS